MEIRRRTRYMTEDPDKTAVYVNDDGRTLLFAQIAMASQKDPEVSVEDHPDGSLVEGVVFRPVDGDGRGQQPNGCVKHVDGGFTSSTFARATTRTATAASDNRHRFGGVWWFVGLHRLTQHAERLKRTPGTCCVTTTPWSPAKHLIAEPSRGYNRRRSAAGCEIAVVFGCTRLYSRLVGSLRHCGGDQVRRASRALLF